MFQENFIHKNQIFTSNKGEIWVFPDLQDKFLFYNKKHLYGVLLSLTPTDYFDGRKESKLVGRRGMLYTEYVNRKAYWLQQQRAL